MLALVHPREIVTIGLVVVLGLYASGGAAESSSRADASTTGPASPTGPANPAGPGNRLEAERRYNDAWGVTPGAPLHMRYAYKMLQASRLGEAREYYEKALELQPGSVKVQMNLARLFLRMNAPEEAIPHLEAVVASSSEGGADLAATVEAHTLLAKIALNAGRTEVAIGHYREAAALETGSKTGSETQLKLGKALLNEDRVAEAIVQFQAIVEAHPKHARAHFHLGRASAKQNDPDAAQEFYRRALELANAAGEKSFAERIERNLR